MPEKFHEATLSIQVFCERCGRAGPVLNPVSLQAAETNLTALVVLTNRAGWRVRAWSQRTEVVCQQCLAEDRCPTCGKVK